MKIMLNGAAQDAQAQNLADLLIEVGMSGKVATARNGDFVPVFARAATPIHDGDRIEVLAPMQGG